MDIWRDRLGVGLWWTRRHRTKIAVAGFALVAGFPAILQSQGTAAANSVLPRFFSLKSNPVTLRKGPGTKYPKAWVFRREGLPVEVLREHGRWRHVRDSEGATGWILRTLISSRRTALVTPWQLKEAAPPSQQLTRMYSSARRSSRTIAKLEAGTLVSLKSCNGRWCHVSIGRFSGYIEQRRLWGIYPQEVLR